MSGATVQELVPGLAALQAITLGDPAVRIAVLDGPADLTHPCFAGADLDVLPTLVPQPARPGPMALHGTHVTSLLFGQPGSPVVGVAPGCHGIVVPVFPDDGTGVVSQLDLARAVEQALDAGAHVINVSGGQRTSDGRGHDLLDRALARCAERGVLVVAATGNDGCDCVQVPAAHDAVLAVGALSRDGQPLASSNWGEGFRAGGLLAPGEGIVGAAPGGTTVALTGTSHATPIVAGVAALLLSRQLHAGHRPDPAAVRDALVASAIPCVADGGTDCRRHLAGTLDVAAAHELVTRSLTPDLHEGVSPMSIPDPPAPPEMTATVVPPAPPTPQAPSPIPGPAVAEAPAPAPPPAPTPTAQAAPAPVGVATATATVPAPTMAPAPVLPTAGAAPDAPAVVAASAGSCGCGGPGHGVAAANAKPSYVYAIGTVGYDFQTEARRDSFLQLMAPEYPYDPKALSRYLAANPWESTMLTWLLMFDQTPMYALEAEPSAGMTWGDVRTDKAGKVLGVDTAVPPVSFVHKMLHDAIYGQALLKNDRNYVSRVSIPGRMTGRTTRLFSGQVVPVIEVQARGLHTWNEAALISAAITEVQADREALSQPPVDETKLRISIQSFLDKIYYQFRNLGQTPEDRALNYAGTNAFVYAQEVGIADGLLSGKFVPGDNEGLFALDSISVSPSPYCRVDSECFDVRISFMDPENERRAKRMLLLTFDSGTNPPVAIGPVHQFLM